MNSKNVIFFISKITFFYFKGLQKQCPGANCFIVNAPLLLLIIHFTSNLISVIKSMNNHIIGTIWIEPQVHIGYWYFSRIRLFRFDEIISNQNSNCWRPIPTFGWFVRAFENAVPKFAPVNWFIVGVIIIAFVFKFIISIPIIIIRIFTTFMIISSRNKGFCRTNWAVTS